jgi:uncharacterized protein (TIGR03032 family)
MTQPTSTPPESPLRSVYTAGLPELFAHLNISLAVTTYQAGKVILVRHDAGAPTNGAGPISIMAPSAHSVINTHFRTFHRPMGLAVQDNKLAIGGHKTVWELHNMPAVARKLEPPGKHDACYLPRRIHVTGDIDIHEMAFAGNGELWIVNTRFGCLCTLDADHSFHPSWHGQPHPGPASQRLQLEQYGRHRHVELDGQRGRQWHRSSQLHHQQHLQR